MTPNMPPPRSPMGMPARVGCAASVPVIDMPTAQGLHHLVEGRSLKVRAGGAEAR
jgi:hypothetical protein